MSGTQPGPRGSFRNTSAADAGVQAAARADDAFGADLYQTVAPQGNTVFSPASVAAALRMTLIGARGETAAEIARALHLEPAAATEGAWPLSVVLAEPAHGEKRLTFHAPNTMWVQSGMPLERVFLTAITDSAAAAVHDADFVHESEKARQEVNRVVAEQTGDKIQDLVPPYAIDGDTRMVLANAIYLKAAWAFPFPADATIPQPFHVDGDADPVTVPMMRLTAQLGYARGDGWQVVTLPYARGIGELRLAMAVVLPDGPLSGMVSQFKADGGLGSLLADVRPTRLELSMPRFRVTAEFSLQPVLERLGIVQAFDWKSADFSGITTAERLFVSAVLHQAYVDVDEYGTEAAAATAVIMSTLSIPAAPQLAVTVDRPFLFAITDTENGVPLFLGQVTNPAND
jgi:serpin B